MTRLIAPYLGRPTAPAQLVAHCAGVAPALFRVSQWWVEPSLQGCGVAAESEAMLLFCRRYLEPLATGLSRHCPLP
jgi:hypothetical protein